MQQHRQLNLPDRRTVTGRVHRCGAQKAPRRAPTMKVYATAWLARLAHEDVSPRTVELYRTNLTQHILPALGTTRLDALDRATCQAFLDDVLTRYAPNTVKLMRSVLQALCSDALARGTIASNPAHQLARIRTQPKVMTVYTGAQLRQFLEAADRVLPAIAPVYALCGQAGLRIGEALGMKGAAIDCAAREIHVLAQANRQGVLLLPKRNRQRVVDCADVLAARLAPLVAARPGLLFTGNRGRPFRRPMVQDGMRTVAAACGLPPIHVHGLRHSYAATLVSEGCDMQWLCQQMGHASIKITYDLYGRWLRVRRSSTLDRAFTG